MHRPGDPRLDRVEREGVVFLRSPLLAALGVPHGFSTRHGGVSAAPFDSLNLGRAGGVDPALSDPAPNRAENLRRFQRAIGIEGRAVSRVHQVHGAAVVVAAPTAGADAWPSADGDPQADAIVSRDPDAALMVTVADCVPILLACPRSGVIGAVHAGWRGLLAGVIGAAMARMSELGAERSELRVAIGPCIGVDAFEVGDEVVTAFRVCGLPAAIHPRSTVRSTIDLAGAAQRRLVELGVRPAHMDRGPYCTHTHAADFFSYRRDGARSGRLGAIIAPIGAAHA